MIFCFSLILSLFSLDLDKVEERIWQKECNGSLEGLVHWNEGEEFGSFGIGHFIWYPKGKKGAFEETFPKLLAFIQESGQQLPPWLTPSTPCPWQTREEFNQEKNHKKKTALRAFLFTTKKHQAAFIAKRLEETLVQMEEAFPEKKELLRANFAKLSATPRGLFALIDYLHFKGSGLSPLERYNNQGWGLVQALESVPPDSPAPLLDFIKVAKALLSKRVENSPAERKESRWLKGWHNRIDSYVEPF